MEEPYQLDFLKEPEISRVEASIERTHTSLTKVRKGTFARINKLEKMLKELQDEHEWFKRAICRGEPEEETIVPIQGELEEAELNIVFNV
jgi:hypothetical protein